MATERGTIAHQGLLTPTAAAMLKSGKVRKSSHEQRLSSDLVEAARILAKSGFTLEQAVGWVERATAWGSIVFRPGAPPALADPTNPCCFALRLVLLSDVIRNADPEGVQVGRLWARATLGMQLPDIAKAARSWLLGVQRGPGGRGKNDLTLTLEVLLRQNPDADWRWVVEYLQDDDAADRFRRDPPENRDIYVTNVGLWEEDGIITYEDRSGTRHSIKLTSLKRKIRAEKPS